MEKLLVAGLLLAGLLALLLSFSRKRPRIITRDLQPVTITGHRGAGGLMAENSLAAIRKGVAIGCNRIEIDVHQTADSVVVVMHDDNINRTTNGKGKIKSMTYRELLQFTLKPLQQDDTALQKIPTLEEAMDAVNGKAVLLIELKEGSAYYPGIEERVVNLIKQKKASGWCMIHSFSDTILNKVHALAPDLPLHKLLLTSLFYNPDKMPFIREVSVYRGGFSQPFIDKVHKAGKKINIWTVNNKDDMQYLMHLGVDGIITDYPDLAKEVLSENKL
jgi:glycerophosphoryl diester phosphodiesterase